MRTAIRASSVCDSLKAADRSSGEVTGLEALESRTVFSVAPAVMAYAAVDSDFNAAVYELAADQKWHEVTLKDIPGTPSDVWNAVAWVDPDDGRPFAAATSAQGLILFTENDAGLWGQRNLTAALPGSEAISEELQIMLDPAGTFHLVGFTSNDDAVNYSLAPGSERWTYRNITQADLIPTGQPLPDIVSDIRTYATGWNGLNAAGVDMNGEVWSIWWAPGRDGWASANLSDITGTSARFDDSLTVYTTPWGGINIAGVATDGHLRVTWWVPQFGGQWKDADLTAAYGGPRLEPQSITSYTTSWGGLNIAGIDEATGHLVQYWWAPGMETWNVTDMNGVTGGAVPDSLAELRGQSGLDDSLNLMMAGVDAQYDFTLQRAYWKPGMTAWATEDVTMVAAPLSTKFPVLADYGYGYDYSYKREYGSQITGWTDQAALNAINAYFISLAQLMSAPGGGAYWYDTGYAGQYRQPAPDECGGYYYSDDGRHYDPYLYCGDPQGMIEDASSTVGFANYSAGPSIPGLSRPDAGVAGLQDLMYSFGANDFAYDP